MLFFVNFDILIFGNFNFLNFQKVHKMGSRNGQNVEGVYPTPTANSIDEVARGDNALNFWKNIPNFDNKVDRLKYLKKEANRLASMANKRVRRLEANNLTNAPAYQAFIQGGGRFSTRGLGYNELQQEISRLQSFLNSQTSTVRGYNNVLKEMANNTGIKYKNLSDLKEKAKNFFELHSKVEQYLRHIQDVASAYSSTQVFESINTYVQQNKLNLASDELDIDGMIAKVGEALIAHDEPFKGIAPQMWFELSDDTHL